MSKFFRIQVSLFLILICLRNARGQDYNSLQLVLQWPVSFCTDINNRDSCISLLSHRFKIHGLRHYNDQIRGFKLYCGGQRVWFEESQIPGNLRVKLNQEWPSLKTRYSNLEFWRYQWRKHGICSGKTVRDYFQLAIKLNKKYADLVDIFKNFGDCSPGEQASCELTKIKNTIESQIGQTPQFRCNRNYEGVIQLLEITFCFDQSGNPMNCVFSDTSCNQTPLILLPSVKTLPQWHDEL